MGRDQIQGAPMRKMIFVAVVCAAGMSACAQRPTPQELSKADYGTYPIDYKEIVESYMRKALFDPYSAVYEHRRGPSIGYVGGNFVETQYGYRVCVDLNAKNRMGGYVGSRTQFFMTKNGIVTFQTEADTEQLCNFT